MDISDDKEGDNFSPPNVSPSPQAQALETVSHPEGYPTICFKQCGFLLFTRFSNFSGPMLWSRTSSDISDAAA
jgi:hypothetical protein